MVPSAPSPLDLKKSKAFCRGYSQITSEFSTKKGSPLPSSRMSRARARGPAVPIGLSSLEHTIFTPSFFSYSSINPSMTFGW